MEKVLGYFLILAGVITIIYSAVSVYMVFTKKAKPIDLFSFSGISIDTIQLTGNKLPEGTPAPKTELIKPDLINETSNIAAHVFLMGFLGSVGYKIASLGVMLARPIIVKLRTKEVSIDNTPDATVKK
ncbi:hypothetical protein A3D00_02430 [Candidatus Woesebacteria bacterium RIFCSPHIGHO2_02_FULL_38_9]|nr:MAG: hypothetical protein A3D00_02430 [Candidatus Woesebacteria bacterium RIFCSPHIGHO2_02_FULL_38_9]OGM58410.1 MAG: hypothetical protein A3A50_02615 [Candidatus Woesebacteria bacterium RIFCSPLOWO2_01_FULL_38_20]